MKVVKLKIDNFRGIKAAELFFNGHTLLVGGNNVGKSTVCEALDLVLGPDRLNKFPAVEEFDFYNACYKNEDGKPVPMKIEVVLTGLSEEAIRLCGNHLEFWHLDEKRLLAEGEISQIDEHAICCLRLQTIAQYVEAEDEFEVETYFSHSPDTPDGELKQVRRNIKRLFGFLYLRTLRTGNRALSLERGSLLDIILRLMNIRSGLWEETRKKLLSLEPPIDEGATELLTLLKGIEKRLSNYIPLDSKERKTCLHVTTLTREHLRKTLSFFLSVSEDQVPIPFQKVGTGTLNALVLALLSYIAESKKDNIIFAMEEPEIALPPHTQRRVVKYLLENSTQCFVSSHSPYVIERFPPDSISILKRTNKGTLEAVNVNLSSGIKAKTYQSHVRRSFAEAILSYGVIIGEGKTEISVLQTVVEIIEKNNSNLLPLDLAGVCFLSVDGDGALPEFGQFFKSLEIPVYAFYDNKKRSNEIQMKLKASFDVLYETKYQGMEDLLAEEISLDTQWEYLSNLKKTSVNNRFGIPENRPNDIELKELTRRILIDTKGEGRAGEFLKLCAARERLPNSIIEFLNEIYKRHSHLNANDIFESAELEKIP
jgi:putative ATP-dependent endonuclease of OLD family